MQSSNIIPCVRVYERAILGSEEAATAHSVIDRYNAFRGKCYSLNPLRPKGCLNPFGNAFSCPGSELLLFGVSSNHT